MKYTITSGVQPSAVRLVIYGDEGIGKSTFISTIPGTLFIDIEGSTKQLHVNRLNPAPTSWDQLLDMIDDVANNPSICRNLAIDTADRAEQLLIDALLTEGHCTSIEQYGGGYGKGYTALAERFTKDFLRRLDRLIAKGVNVSIISHATTRKFESPTDPPFDRWEMSLSKKVAPLLKQWCDALGFVSYEFMVEKTKSGKAKAVGSEKRIISFNHKPTYDAKNRYKLGDRLPLEYDSIRKMYESQPEPERTELTIDSPHTGIVEGDEGLEDVRDLLVRRLNEKGVETIRFEAWLVATGRLQPGSHYTALSGTQARQMLDHIDLLVNQVKPKEEEDNDSII